MRGVAVPRQVVARRRRGRAAARRATASSPAPARSTARQRQGWPVTDRSTSTAKLMPLKLAAVCAIRALLRAAPRECCGRKIRCPPATPNTRVATPNQRLRKLSAMSMLWILPSGRMRSRRRHQPVRTSRRSPSSAKAVRRHASPRRDAPAAATPPKHDSVETRTAATRSRRVAQAASEQQRTARRRGAGTAGAASTQVQT